MIRFKSQKEHQQDVASCQKKLQTLDHSEPLSLGATNSNTLRNGEYKQTACKLDLSRLNSILHIDKERLIAVCEPKVTIHELVRTTLEYDLIPPVVPEFETITVGGAINGAALETSSHKFGQFNDICLEYEILLSDGTLLKASADNHPDLFFGISGSYGTLAILTLVTLKLIPAKKGIHLTLSRFNEPNELIAAMRTLLKKEKRPDIIEGGVLSPNWAVMITGSYVDRFTSPHLFSQKHFWDPWYYQQITNSSLKAEQVEVDMPLIDYLFRFDRGAFWMGRFLLSWSSMLQICFKWRLPEVIAKLAQNAEKLTPTTHPSALFRSLFGWALSSKRLYQVWHKVPKEISESLFFIQDFYTPLAKAEEGFKTFSENTGILPIWLCPILGTTTSQILSPHYVRDKKFFINFGVYGVPLKGKPTPEITSECEKAIFQLGGRKMLYAHTYFSKELFSKMYDLPRYEQLCKKYLSNNVFLPIYNKITNK